MEVSAGFMTKQDALVRFSDENCTLQLEVRSSVSGLFGKAVRKAAGEELSRLNVINGRVWIEDNHALDFVIRARIQAVVMEMREAGCKV